MSAGDPAPASESATLGNERRFLWTSLAVFSGLTAVLFWRYALSPATAVSDPGDPLLLIWIMEWVERALIHSPRALFDAPMFHPFADTLAYSDPLLPQSVFALPLRLVGFGPVFAYNAAYLAGIVSAGVLTAALFLRLTGDRVAALLGAVVATFPALRLFHLAHMQLQVTTFLPLVLLLVHRVVKRPSLRSAAWLALALAAAPLASLYYGLFLALLLPPFVLTLWLVSPNRQGAPLRFLAGAGAAAAVALTPFALVYHRAIAHIAIERSEHGYSDVLDYFGVSPFANVAHVLPLRALETTGPQWVGGCGALLLPVVAVSIVVAVVRGRVSGSGAPAWVAVAAPYVVLGCFAIALSLGPEVQVRGHTLFKDPIGYVTRMPGAREIRDFQRLGFVIAVAGGAIVAMMLAELARRGFRRALVIASTFVAVTTLVPSFSSFLPVYRPPPRSSLDPVYRWLEEQPEPMVIFEVPLPARSELEPLEYLWAAVLHQKALIHGFSGYLPLTDDLLRGESTGIYRPDFFEALGLLGATHVVVHTKDLSELPGGSAALAKLRDTKAVDRVARFPFSEAYRIEPIPARPASVPSGNPETPLFATGGWVDPAGTCVEVGLGASPLVYYVPRSARVSGLRFYAQSSLSDMDDSLVVERSDDLQAWTVAPHGGLLSGTLASYVDRPTPLPWSDVLIPPEPGAFLRLTTKRSLRVRLCDVSLLSTKTASVVAVPRGAMHIDANFRGELPELAIDGNPATRWHSGEPQNGGEWIDVNLEKDRQVVAVVLELGAFDYDHGRRLAVDCGSGLDSVDRGHDLEGAAVLFERPRSVQILPLSPPRVCRSLRIRQTGTSPENHWSVAEITVLEREAARSSN